MNEDLYLEKVSEEQYRMANDRPYSKFKFSPEEEGYGPPDCEECGEAIPIRRREYGYSLCVKCKQIQEAKG